jgi:pimeloyl-[acyl-carrier protein] methyl ester esterase
MKLVFLHGWGYTPRLWDGLRGELAAFESAAPLLCPPSPDLLDWSDRLAADLPDGALLIGWSLGAMLAMACAARHGSKVRGLCLLGASPKFVASDNWQAGLAADTVSAFRTGFSRQPARTLQRFLALQVMGDVARPALTPVLEAALAAPTETSLDAGLQILEAADLRSLLPKIQQPVRLLHGTGDALMPLAAAQWLSHALPAATLACVPDAGHALMLHQPAWLAGQIRELARAC